MALPSQSDRTSELGRAYVYREKGGGGAPPKKASPKALLAIAGSVILVGAAWGIVRIFPSRSDTPPVLTPEQVVPVTAGFGASPEPTPVLTMSTGRQEAKPTEQKPLEQKPVEAKPIEPRPVEPPKSEPRPEGTRPRLDDPSKLVVEDPSRTANTAESVPAPLAAPQLQPQTQPQNQLPPSASTADVISLMAQGETKLTSDPVQARVLLSKAYPKAAPSDQAAIRAKLEELNKTLLFSPKVTPGDPLTELYTIASGDSFVRITKKHDLAVHWGLLQRINGISPNALRVGQKIKLVRGPFHAVVHKSDYRIDIFQGAPDDPASWLFIKSCKVGLGEGNSTPPGTFVIRKNSKLMNPHWANPRTGQKFDADDPLNPIGERWLGFEGVGDSAPLTGYGLHGTIDPSSIGQQKSMGCVRMGDDDIALIYELLEEQVSVVKILP